MSERQADALRRLEVISRALGGLFPLVVWVAVEQLRWSAIGRRLGIDHRTARTGCTAAIAALAALRAGRRADAIWPRGGRPRQPAPLPASGGFGPQTARFRAQTPGFAFRVTPDRPLDGKWRCPCP